MAQVGAARRGGPLREEGESATARFIQSVASNNAAVIEAPLLLLYMERRLNCSFPFARDEGLNVCSPLTEVSTYSFLQSSILSLFLPICFHTTHSPTESALASQWFIWWCLIILPHPRSTESTGVAAFLSGADTLT